ncbi:hypothetical protein [Nitrosomonas communis]|uniref:Uncharacterized protein n=1 Tax=Nitrosomonas communis TaxID=44574 RepID=A0A1H2S3F4_9PROT|nr:hypothetical protein [Nitrosomonas communis]SDW26232.1 hypothetical protein SAMN05421882_100622 [Nitrosomonas communis]
MTQHTKLLLKESYAILANFNIVDIVEPDNLKKDRKSYYDHTRLQIYQAGTLLGRSRGNCLMHFTLIAEGHRYYAKRSNYR